MLLGQGWSSAAQGFDPKQLEALCCPLSKAPLRYEPTTNELVCDELSVAYPIKEGIPQLNPTSGRIINKVTETSSPSMPTGS